MARRPTKQDTVIGPLFLFSGLPPAQAEEAANAVLEAFEVALRVFHAANCDKDTTEGARDYAEVVACLWTHRGSAFGVPCRLKTPELLR